MPGLQRCDKDEIKGAIMQTIAFYKNYGITASNNGYTQFFSKTFSALWFVTVTKTIEG